MALERRAPEILSNYSRWRKANKNDVDFEQLKRESSPSVVDCQEDRLSSRTSNNSSSDSPKTRTGRPRRRRAIESSNSTGVDVNKESAREKLRPRMAAASRSHYDVKRMLISSGRASNVDREGNTALHLLIRYSLSRISTDGMKQHFADTVDELLSAYCKDTAAVNAVNDLGQSALYWAAQCDMLDVCRLLIRHGADPNAAGIGRFLPLVCAVENENIEMIELFLAAGADPNGKDQTTEQHMKNRVDDPTNGAKRNRNNCATSNCRNPLPINIALVCWNRSSSTTMLKQLIDAGADVNRLDESGLSPLHRAVDPLQLGRFVTGHRYREIVESDADVDRAEVAYEYQLERRRQCVEILLQAGADPNVLSKDGLKPLAYLADSFYKYRRNDAYSEPTKQYRSTVTTFYETLIERRDGLGASLADDRDDKVRLSDLLLYCDSETVNLMLRMLADGVGLRTLADLCRGAFLDRKNAAHVSVELCEAVVLLTDYRVRDEDVEDIRLRQMVLVPKFAMDKENLMCLADWLVEQKRNPSMLQQLCRTVIRKRLSIANGHVCMGLLVDRLVPHCPGINRYIKSVWHQPVFKHD